MAMNYAKANARLKATRSLAAIPRGPRDPASQPLVFRVSPPLSKATTAAIGRKVAASHRAKTLKVSLAPVSLA